MLNVVYEDIDSHKRRPFDFARTAYDTPFFTGNPNIGPLTEPDNIVIIGGNEYTQSEVNYVAQGMYSAKAGQKLEGPFGAENLAKRWNRLFNNDEVTSGEKYWLRYGFNYFNDRKEKE